MRFVCRNCYRPMFSIFNVGFEHLKLQYITDSYPDRGSTVVKVLCYKSEGCWFDPSWCYWNFSLT